MKINQTKFYMFLLLVTIMAVYLSACHRRDNFDDLQAKLLMIKKAREYDHKKNAMAELSIPAPVVYGQSDSSLNAPSTKSLDPLQAFPVAQLKFIGTVLQDNVVQAYVATPDGKVFSVKKGDSIGDHYGKITHIDSNQIEVAQNERTEGKKSIEKIIVMKATE